MSALNTAHATNPIVHCFARARFHFARTAIIIFVVGTCFGGWFFASSLIGERGRASQSTAGTSSSTNTVKSANAPAQSAAHSGKRITVDAVTLLPADTYDSAANAAPAGEHFVRLDVTQERLDNSEWAGGYNAWNFVIVGSDAARYQYSGYSNDSDWFTSGDLESAGDHVSGNMLFTLPDGVSPVTVLANFTPLGDLELVATVS